MCSAVSLRLHGSARMIQRVTTMTDSLPLSKSRGCNTKSHRHSRWLAIGYFYPSGRVLDSFSRFPQYKYIVGSHISHISRLPPRRLNQSIPATVRISSEGLLSPLPGQGRPSRQRELRLPHVLMNEVRSGPRGFNSASAHSSERVHITGSSFVRSTKHFSHATTKE